MTRYFRDQDGRRWQVREVPPRQSLPGGFCALEFLRDDGELAVGVGQMGWMAATEEELRAWLAAAAPVRGPRSVGSFRT